MNPYLFNPRIIDLKTPEYPNDIPGDFIRLHLMENPYSLPINVSEAIHHALNNTVLNRYPDSNHSNLKQKLRDTFSIPDNAEILTGNGSFELLQSVFLSMLNPDQCFLSLMPGFFFYQLSSHILGQRCINVKPRENLFDTIEKHQPSLIIIDNPNNPMGTILSCDYLEKALQAASGLVLIDEAYFHYGRVTMMPF
ncbi:MAG: aminotransferase class I/II-fold pyridoxal phosphate-dependent enzyme, partial [Coxiellaceae bacterium]|nr:aminotransferase class I/II-fold pyridoxal phosphate-dependent enzyme [Coxiellaceae bacterium]